MDTKEVFSILEPLFPAVFGGALCLLAIGGMRELLKETSMAFKKGIKA